MLQRRIDFFLQLIFTPTGVVLMLGLIACIVVLFKKKESFWYFLSVLALVSSFNEFHNEFFEEAPPLVGPLQIVRTYGRPLSIFLLILLAVYSFFTPKGRSIVGDQYGIIQSLFAIQTLILLKNIFYGNSLEGLLAFSVFLLVMFVFRGAVNLILSSQRDEVERSVLAFASAVIVFDVCAFYQSRVDFSAMLFPSGQFLGMTGNAQHAAVLLASGVPFFIYLIFELKGALKIFVIAGLLSTLYYLLLTASRTGTAMVIASIGVFGILGGAKSILKWLGLAMVILVVLNFTEYNPLSELNEEAFEHYTSTENSREEVIEIQLRMFSNNFLFGADPRGQRVGFGESSYFGVAASLGIVGLIPLSILMIGCLRLIVQLVRTSFIDKKNRQRYLMVVGGLVPLLLGASVEAYLLGIVTWPLIVFLMYVSWGNHLVMESKLNTAQWN